MASGYGINSIGSYANDPYFAYALNSYNPNFQGTQSAGGTPTVAAPAVNTESAATANLPKADYSEDSNAGKVAAVIGTLVGAGTLIAAYKKGKGTGEGLTRIKNGFKKIFGIGDTNKTTNAASETISNTIRAMKSKDGKLVYTIPGKNKTLRTQAEIQQYAADYGIDLKQLQKFNSKQSKLNEYQLEIKDGGKTNTVTVKNGEIVDINNGTESITKKILDSTDGADKEFRRKIEDQIADIEKGLTGDNLRGKTIRYIKYQTQIGDDIVNVTRTSLEDKPKIDIDKFTTPERFSQDSDAVKAYLYNNPEAKKVFLSETLKKGKIPEGMKVESFDFTFDKHTKCHYKDGKLVGITKDGEYCAKGSEKCDAFLADNETTLNKEIEDLVKNGELKDYENPVLIAE